MRRALITGVTGQDGQHLAQLLHEKGYQVFGVVKGQNNPKLEMMRDEFPFVEIVPGDLADLPSLVKALEVAQPHEVYNLAAISFVALSWNQAELTSNLTGTGVLRMLEAVRMVGGAQNNTIRFYQASSSEMFGKVREIPQSEMTPFHPRSPYGCAKVFGHHITSTIARATASTPARAFSSITRVRVVASSSSRARSPTRRPASSWGFRTRWSWATSTPSAIGVTPATT